ncbi:hypothetical protein M378DRAFT_169093 [Amanita muscaria Koide BX008]|uniref:Uncharacterized protein n=1 Tax=Amanita muscaria (strain Koide BX008) TaxID=946122 RepID=A0A0C2WTD2_AMAMK|nr:hypothetical protein M378DRAFT_169093 [Amanita muscaria Koide BX008]
MPEGPTVGVDLGWQTLPSFCNCFRVIDLITPRREILAIRRKSKTVGEKRQACT